MSKVTVKAGVAKDGTPLFVHFPARVITAPGARTLVITGDITAEVDDTQLFVRKRLRVGDLVIVKTVAAKPKAKPKAKAPKTEGTE